MNNQSQQLSRLERLITFLDRDPKNPNLLSDALRLAQELGDLQKAQLLLEHVDQYGAPTAALAAHTSLLHLRVGNAEAAARFGEAALASDLNDTNVRINTAYAQLYNGNFARVDELLSQPVLETCPPEVLIVKARALHHLGKAEDAKQLLLKAIKDAPVNPDALGLLALLEHEDSNHARAMELAESALRQNATQLEALLALAGSHFDQDQITDARAIFQTTLTSHPECGRAWSGLAQVAFWELDFANAEQYLQKAVKHMPNHIGTWHLLAWIYILHGNTEQARIALEKSYELDRNFGNTHGGLAVVDIMQGRDEDARVRIRTALRLAPEGNAARYAEMLLLEKAGKPSEMREKLDFMLRQTGSRNGTPAKLVAERKLHELLARQKQVSKPPH